MKIIKNAKGITLIALVITIIVLLILAAITLSTLAGRRGIINQAQNAEKEHTKASALEDITIITYQSLDNKGYTDTAKLEQGLNDIGATIKSKTETIWIVELNEYEFAIDIEEGDVNENNSSYGGIYSEPGLEGKIAPIDLFTYEKITDATASLAPTTLLATSESGLPKARITGLNKEYCNGPNYTDGYADTYYKVIYNGEPISDILVIPYQVEIDGELYEITEVNLFVTGSSQRARSVLPRVKTIILPNTVEKIIEPDHEPLGEAPAAYRHELEQIILPKSLTLIPNLYFYTCVNLAEVTIPENVTSIGEDAFYGCSALTTITIPKSVTRIDGSAFDYCSALTTVNYEGTEEEWNEITISYGNSDLTNATINYNYKITTGT